MNNRNVKFNANTHTQEKCIVTKLQSNLNSLNTDASFTMANSNSSLSPYEILPKAQENKYLVFFFFYFIMKLYVVCKRAKAFIFPYSNSP